jgi:outer membrane protein
MVIRSLGVVLATVALAAVAIGPAFSADQSVGFVDVQKVFSDYSKTKTANTELEALGKQLDVELTALSLHKLLNDTERKQLVDLVTKPTPTDKDKEQLKALDDREKALEQELQGLQSKNPPSEAEKARQKELSDVAAKSDEYIAKRSAESEKQFNDAKDAKSKLIRDDIVKAIDTVAKDKKLTLVIDKIAVLYGGTDVTQPVIDNLNKK